MKKTTQTEKDKANGYADIGYNAPQHTPGPWHLNKLETVAATIHACRGHVATVSNGTMHELSPVEIEANARLIAAAPDLLKACRLFMHFEHVDCHTKDGSVHDHTDDGDCPQCVARAAIAKATN